MWSAYNVQVLHASRQMRTLRAVAAPTISTAAPARQLTLQPTPQRPTRSPSAALARHRAAPPGSDPRAAAEAVSTLRVELPVGAGPVVRPYDPLAPLVPWGQRNAST